MGVAEINEHLRRLITVIEEEQHTLSRNNQHKPVAEVMSRGDATHAAVAAAVAVGTAAAPSSAHPAAFAVVANAPPPS